MSIRAQKERNSAKVLFDFSDKKPSATVANKTVKKRLKDFSVIKPGVGEKIHCVQRRHKIAILSSLIQQTFIFISLIIFFFFVTGFLQETFSVNLNSWIVITYIGLTVISLFSVSVIFIFMNWYYEFYIITNRSILHRYCFRLAGPFSEIVYGDRMHLREIVRVPTNLLYDILKIEDVQIYFQKQEQEEPFIFKTPSDAQEIEDLIHDLAIAQKEHRKLYD